MPDQLKMTLATVAVEHGLINPLGRKEGRRYVFDCICGGEVVEDHTQLPVIHRDAGYNLHLLLAAMRAIAPTAANVRPRRRCTCEVGMGTYPGPHHEHDPDTGQGCQLYEPTAEGKPA